MKAIIPLTLIWLSFALLNIAENIWIENITPNHRIDIYNPNGIIERNELTPILKENPDWNIVAVIETTGSVNKTDGLNVIAISGDVMENNPLKLIKGEYYLDNAVLLNRDLAFNLFKTDDVIGEMVLFNKKLHVISGIFTVQALIKEFSMITPDIITSLNNRAITDRYINLLQIFSSRESDVNDLNIYFDVNSQLDLMLNKDLSLIKQLRDILYLTLGILVLFSLLKILKLEFKQRRDHFQENIKREYFIRSLTNTLYPKPHRYIVPIIIGILLTNFLKFTIYIPPEILSTITLKSLILSPLKFILTHSVGKNPVISLQEIIKVSCFCIIVFIYIPGFLLLLKTKYSSLKLILLIPVINTIFTFFMIFLKVEPTLNLKINLMIILLVIVQNRRLSNALLS